MLTCAHSGLVFACLMAIGIFGIAGWMPLIPPSADADAIASLFADDRMRMRFGMSILALIQNLSIGLCILGDKHEQPVYPRWVGFANIWFAILVLPGAMLPFFKAGPFAWNGLIGFWLVAFAFFGWILMMWWMTSRAIRSPASAAVRADRASQSPRR